MSNAKYFPTDMVLFMAVWGELLTGSSYKAQRAAQPDVPSFPGQYVLDQGLELLLRHQHSGRLDLQLQCYT